MNECPWCRRLHNSLLGLRPDGKKVFICDSCRLIYREGDAEGETYYDKAYYKANAEVIRQVEIKQQIRYNLVQYLVKKPEAVLDIACGDGYFLEKMRAHCSEVIGIDFSPAAVELCREKGLMIYKNRIEDFSPRRQFDLITAWEIIEHIKNLAEFLEAVDRLMAYGGMFILSTPNAGSYRAKKYGIRWSGFTQSPEHVCFFTADVLENILKTVFPTSAIRFIEFEWRGEDTLVAVVQKGKRKVHEGLKKVLFVGRNNGLELVGGDMIQLFKTRQALEEMGVAIDISLSVFPSLPFNYDLIHQYGFANAEAIDQLYHIRDKTDNIVLSPIYWNLEEEKMATESIVEIVKCKNDIEEVCNTLQRYGEGKLKVIGIRDYYTPYEMLKESRSELLKLISLFLPNSYAEMEFLRRDFNLWRADYKVIPNAVEVEKFLHADPRWFEEKYGLKDFLLCAARFELRKNQLMLLLAIRELNIPCVMIGKPNAKEYYNLCRKYAPRDTIFIDFLPHDLLASAYAAARVHALVSWCETPGLSSLEAALAGCSVVVSDRGPTWEYFGELAYYCDPGRLDSIAEAVFKAWRNHSAEKSQALREKILGNYTWSNAAAKTLEAYLKIKNKKHKYEEDVLEVPDKKTRLSLKFGEARCLAIFGASLTGRECYQIALKEGKQVKFFLDNSPARQWTTFLGLPVYPVEYINDPRASDVDAIILASGGYQEQMAQQLMDLGCKKKLIRP